MPALAKVLHPASIHPAMQRIWILYEELKDQEALYALSRYRQSHLCLIYQPPRIVILLMRAMLLKYTIWMIWMR